MKKTVTLTKPLTTETSVRERAFTLVEVLIGIVVIGILAAIVIPIFVQQQKDVNSAKYKSELQQAAFLVEQEAVDNNGLYPTYLPNEVKNSDAIKNLVYSYSGTRTDYCLQSSTPYGKFYISSNDPKKILTTSCTLEYIASGTIAPWSTPTITPLTTPTVAISWAMNTPAALLQPSANAVSCTLQADDQAEWGATGTVTYRYVITNYDRGGTEFVTAWSTNRTPSVNLTGWYPTERVAVQAQSKCVIGGETDYAYLSDLSAAKVVTVPDFVMPTASFTSSSADWATDVVKVNAAWAASLACPVGERYYDFDAIDTAKGTYLDWTTSSADLLPWASSAAVTSSTGMSPTGAVTIKLTYKCLLSTGRIISSNTATAALDAGLKPPVAPTGLTSTYRTGDELTPSSLTWNAVTCGAGTPQYIITRTAPSSTTSGWQTGQTFDLTLTVNTLYSYQVAAKCVNGSVSSDTGPKSATYSFTAKYYLPSQPSAPTGLALTVSTSKTVKTGHTLTWNAVTCVSGSVSYQVTRTRIDGNPIANATGAAWQTSTTYNIPASDLKFGSTVGYTVVARCSLNGIDKGSSASAEKTGTLGITAPSATSVSNNGTNNTSWTAVSCPADTTTSYRSVQTLYGGDNSTRSMTTWTTSQNSNVSAYRQGYPLQVSVDVRCEGANLNSATSSAATTSWTSALSKPNGVNLNLGGANNKTISWTGGGGCPTGSTASYYWFQSNSNFGGWPWNNASFQVAGGGTSVTRPGFETTAIVTMWVTIQQNCATQWVTSENTVTSGSTSF